MTKDEGNAVWNVIKLFVTIALIGGFVFAVKMGIDAMNAAVESTKASLEGKGVKLSKEGVAVKTDKRALTQEETQDRIKEGMMTGWKNSKFEVPWLLQKTTYLGGSSHDKNKAEWDKTHPSAKKKE